MHNPSQKTYSDALLILSVLVIASCGLAYELIVGALASYVLGDSVLQFSTIIGAYLFAMGIGAHLSKYVPQDKLLQRFIEIEILVGVIGGCSAICLFIAFAWLPQFQALLYSLVIVIGTLVGMEIPLVMRLLHARKQEFSELVSQVLTFDYLGALIVSVLFPMVLAPMLGLARSAVLFGLANVLVAFWTVWHFYGKKPALTQAQRQQKAPIAQQAPTRTLERKNATFVTPTQVKNGLLLRIGIAFSLLLGAMIYADKLVQYSEQKRFDAPIIFATASKYQRLVVTERNGFYQLYLNGHLQFSTRDEYRYHEALVHPAMQYVQNNLSPMRPTINVLILGGGDGMGAREVLKYPQVKQVTLVDLDKKMTDVFATQSRFTALNKNSLTHPKLTVVNTDAYKWLEETNASHPLYDMVIIDLPDPSQYSLAKLYSVSMYRLLEKQLASEAVVVVQATSPFYAPKSYWSINETFKQAGFVTTPYHLYVPSFGEWGYIIAKKQGTRLFEKPKNYQVDTQFLTPQISDAMFVFPKDMQPIPVKANTVDTQPLVRYYQEDWKDE